MTERFWEGQAGPLRWTQPSLFHREYELHSGEEKVGSLSFEGWLHCRARVEVGGQSWVMERRGLWEPRVEVRNPGADASVAMFQSNWLGSGSLTLADGTRADWRKKNFWGTEWAFQTPSESRLVTFLSDQGFRVKMGVKVEPSGERLADVALLIGLGFYLVMLRRAAAAAAAS